MVPIATADLPIGGVSSGSARRPRARILIGADVGVKRWQRCKLTRLLLDPREAVCSKSRVHQHHKFGFYVNLLLYPSPRTSPDLSTQHVCRRRTKSKMTVRFPAGALMVEQ